MTRFKAGIVGGAGYTAGELIRILIHHPVIQIKFIQSTSHAGRPVSAVHDDLAGFDLPEFTGNADSEIDVLFLCKGHNESAKFLTETSLPSTLRIIDLSQDFRIRGRHPEILKKFGEFIYGLPEINRSSIVSAKNIANPGCFATCIQLGLLPLASAGLISNDIHISAITGSTGAGQQLSETSHFSWRNNNVSVYKPLKHQHLDEVRQTLRNLQPGLKNSVNFIPYRGSFTRGILATSYIENDLSFTEAINLYKSFYKGAPFVRIAENNIHVKQAVNTNYCFIYIEKVENTLVIISAIDNLLKGASGQAVQNMNLMLGIPENTALLFKPLAY